MVQTKEIEKNWLTTSRKNTNSSGKLTAKTLLSPVEDVAGKAAEWCSVQAPTSKPIWGHTSKWRIIFLRVTKITIKGERVAKAQGGVPIRKVIKLIRIVWCFRSFQLLSQSQSVLILLSLSFWNRRFAIWFYSIQYPQSLMTLSPCLNCARHTRNMGFYVCVVKLFLNPLHGPWASQIKQSFRILRYPTYPLTLLLDTDFGEDFDCLGCRTAQILHRYQYRAELQKRSYEVLWLQRREGETNVSRWLDGIVSRYQHQSLTRIHPIGWWTWNGLDSMNRGSAQRQDSVRNHCFQWVWRVSMIRRTLTIVGYIQHAQKDISVW